MQLFCDQGLFSVPGTCKQAAVRLVTCGFYVLNHDRGTRTIPNRKKVANPTVILFLGSRGCRAQAPWRGGGALMFRLTRFAGGVVLESFVRPKRCAIASLDTLRLGIKEAARGGFSGGLCPALLMLLLWRLGGFLCGSPGR